MSEETTTTPGRPDDVIEGGDPTVVVQSFPVEAHLVSCVRCGWQVVRMDEDEALENLDQHIRFGHPAYRNPDIACQETGITSGMCVRAKGHDGRHWTPSFNGGRWWHNGSSTQPKDDTQ